MSYGPLKMAGRDGVEPPTSSSRGKRSAAELPAYGGEARGRTENRWNQNPLLCQLSYLPTNNGVTGGNRTHVGCSTDIRLNHSATATLGAWSWNRANLYGFSDRR